MEGRELRRCYTQVDFGTIRYRNGHMNTNPAQARLRQSPAVSTKAKTKFPTMEIYRPPGQRSDGGDAAAAAAGSGGAGGQASKLNVHAKEFVMTPNTLQTSKSVGNMTSAEGKSTSPTTSILVTPGKSSSSSASKNNHVRWEERRPGSGGASGPGTLQRSKSMTTGATVKGPSPTRSFQATIVTPMGPMSQSDYVNIKHAIDGTNKLTSEEVMGIVKILIDRAIEGRNYAIIIAAACDKIIDNDDGMMFFESLVNYCLFTLNKLKENTVNRRYNGIMGFVCELYLTMKSKQAMNGLGPGNKESKRGLLSPCQSLLRLIVKCGHDVLNDPHLHLKPDQVESLFLTVMTVGQDVERELPTGMESLLAAIRDSFIANSRLTHIIKHKLLQIIETHASGWQLPAFTLMYYNATTH